MKCEFIPVLQEAVVASGGGIVGVSISTDGELQTILAGSFQVEVGDEVARQLITLATMVISKVCKKTMNWRDPRPQFFGRSEEPSTFKTFDVAVAAEILKMSSCSLQKLAKDGEIPAAKVGKRWVFTEEDLAAYLRAEIKKQTAERRDEKPEPDRQPEPIRRAKPPRRRPAPPPLLPSMQGYKP